MSIDPSKSECTHAGPDEPICVHDPCSPQRKELPCLTSKNLVWFIAARHGRKDSVVERKGGFDEARDACSCLRVTDVGFYRSYPDERIREVGPIFRNRFLEHRRERRELN